MAGGLALGLSVVPAGAAQAASSPTATITTTPAVEIGQPVDVTLNVADVSDVYSYAITFNFDPALFDYDADSATDGPAGGYNTVVEGPGTVTLVYSRLGTSPALAVPPAAPIALPAALSFTTVGVGSGTITASVSIVGTGGAAAAPIADVVSDPVAVAALPVVTPSPTPTPSATVAPAADSTPTPVASATGNLAFTGFDGGMLLILAAGGLVVIGAGALVVRRRIASTR